MRGKLVAVFLAGLVVGAVVALAGWHPRALGGPAPQAQQWEYKVVQVNYANDEVPVARMMNILGADGWEYAGLLVNERSEKQSASSLVAFKRLKK
jgi:hypothetical protein